MEFFIPNLLNLPNLPQCIVIPTPLPISEHPLAAHAPNSAPINPYNASNNFFQFITFSFQLLLSTHHPANPQAQSRGTSCRTAAKVTRKWD